MKFNIINAFHHTIDQVVDNKTHWIYVGCAYMCVPFVSLLIALILAVFNINANQLEMCSVTFFLIIRYSFLLLGWYTFGWLTTAFVHGLVTK